MLALAAFVVAAAWNTRAVGGSDSSCYVLQADAFARGRVALPPVPAELPPGVTPAALAPVGFIPSPKPPHAAVPICAPGLAAGDGAGVSRRPRAVFFVVPLFAALPVWCTFVLGRAMDDDITGIGAALLLACSPIFLYQSVQPMSDVPAAALWLAAFVLRTGHRAPAEIVAGVCASLAVLTRPNLAVLAILLPLLRKR